MNDSNAGTLDYIRRIVVLCIVVSGSVFVVWHFGSRPYVEAQTSKQMANLHRIYARAEEMHDYLVDVERTIDECKAASDSVARLSARAKEVAETAEAARYAADAATHQANHTGVLVAELHQEFAHRTEIIMRRLDRIEMIYEDLVAEVRGHERECKCEACVGHCCECKCEACVGHGCGCCEACVGHCGCKCEACGGHGCECKCEACE